MNSSNVFIVSQHLQVATLAKTKNNNLQSSLIKAAVVSDSGTRVQRRGRLAWERNVREKRVKRLLNVEIDLCHSGSVHCAIDVYCVATCITIGAQVASCKFILVVS